jgi:hypothetical protein
VQLQDPGSSILSILFEPHHLLACIRPDGTRFEAELALPSSRTQERPSDGLEPPDTAIRHSRYSAWGPLGSNWALSTVFLKSASSSCWSLRRDRDECLWIPGGQRECKPRHRCPARPPIPCPLHHSLIYASPLLAHSCSRHNNPSTHVRG